MKIICFFQFCLLSSSFDNLKIMLLGNVLNGEGVVVEYPILFHGFYIYFCNDYICFKYRLYGEKENSIVVDQWIKREYI